ncbi:MAG: VIT1/CCC1 transporter family protein [Candidatus Parvarchaeota archaeon]|nr:VIT1/CCC1 transporter family protein [Candidatus Jingweiarchaeum tengchongense]MCW1298122.1 VIT1/CCC1 transporter family protein [Candidatus Jingweiarchaeum tengchongense]MCW1299921.1 VIT1/CCC1 transporter family protein [Candidatus Jingweiarchaeum tengchongense]MCW1305126.1 VIT1/CCC1 transporter family protein [Candidatus Jingweiarchaeum tengchongense]MCW1305543.1 VIT1/CCC1 transporter family protein [Candidatus Jingweiarchaeum tengchongense]
MVFTKTKKLLRNFARGITDGILTSLGLLIGTYYSGSTRIMLTVVLAGGLANSISNFTGAFIGETAELYRRIHQIKRDIGKNDEKSLKIIDFLRAEVLEEERDIHHRGIVDGVGTFIGSLFVISPVLFISNINNLLLASLMISFLLLSTLGGVIAYLSKEDVLSLSAKMCIIGLITLILCSLISKIA